MFATRLALDYRMQFRHDVVIDIVCFPQAGPQRAGHPSLTQPLMYKRIGHHPGTRKLYADKLTTQGVLAEGDADQMVKDYRQLMEDGQRTIEPVLTDYKSKYAIDWSPFLGAKWTDQADTAVPLAELKRIGERITTVPEGFTVHPLVAKLLNDRRNMAKGEVNLDWGMGEHLAFATLVASGYAVRITGQDSGRGTFTHRHAVLHDQNRERWNDGFYVPLQNVSEGQAPFTVIDSVLSEEAVLAFEYGYSSAEPNTLTIWEAQFGDFVNGAQVVIDQFITAGEAKLGPPVGPDPDAAARLRRPGSGALVGPHRALPAAVRRPQHPGGPADLGRADFPPAASPDDPPVPQAAGHLHAQVPAAQQGCRLAPDRSGRRQLPPGDRRGRRVDQGRFGQARAGLLGQGLLRPGQRPPRAWRRPRGDCPRRAAVPVRAQGVRDRAAQNYSKATEVVWVQDEPQNQGPWFYVQHHL